MSARDDTPREVCCGRRVGEEHDPNCTLVEHLSQAPENALRRATEIEWRREADRLREAIERTRALCDRHLKAPIDDEFAGFVPIDEVHEALDGGGQR